MMPLSEIIRSYQRNECVQTSINAFKPHWVDSLTVTTAHTNRIELNARVGDEDWSVLLTPSFHCIAVKVFEGSNPKTQSRLSKDLGLRLNN